MTGTLNANPALWPDPVFVSSGSSYYTITITNNFTGNTAPNDGFIDHHKVSDYVTDFSNPPDGFDLALSLAKRRANYRYLWMLQQIDLLGNCYATAQNPVGGSATAAPTSYVFIATLAAGLSSLVTADESNPGFSLYGGAALVRAIARAMIATTSVNTDYFDPTTSTSTGTFGTTTAAIRVGTRVGSLTVGPLTSSLSTATSAIALTGALPGLLS